MANIFLFIEDFFLIISYRPYVPKGKSAQKFLEIIAISTSKLYVHFWSHEYEYDDKGNRSIMCQLASSCWFLAY